MLWKKKVRNQIELIAANSWDGSIVSKKWYRVNVNSERDADCNFDAKGEIVAQVSSILVLVANSKGDELIVMVIFFINGVLVYVTSVIVFNY